MVRTIREFMDDIRSLRREMYLHGESADSKLVASWLDRLVISMEKISPRLDLMAEELDQLAEAKPLAELRRRKSTRSAPGKSSGKQVSSTARTAKRKQPAAKRSRNAKRGAAKKLAGSRKKASKKPERAPSAKRRTAKKPLAKAKKSAPKSAKKSGTKAVKTARGSAKGAKSRAPSTRSKKKR